MWAWFKSLASSAANTMTRRALSVKRSNNSGLYAVEASGRVGVGAAAKTVVKAGVRTNPAAQKDALGPHVLDGRHRLGHLDVDDRLLECGRDVLDHDWLARTLELADVIDNGRLETRIGDVEPDFVDHRTWEANG